MSDDGGKVDIPEFFEELSGDDCSEENVELKASSGSMMNSFSDVGEPFVVVPSDSYSSLAIVPYYVNKFVEMLVASEH
ncbi:hypothetical protein GUJ93_ZPchr0001g29638 [Zizania palustris]|uniref:Uncharacterized protein n=1 Tax=Zizania palustris TaxID=103762 RepID=A0A8J5S8U1_ZIZPA|nr:hypothetical protein GUJ93_ZPchr0001g29638 [Zizania palustris]